MDPTPPNRPDAGPDAGPDDRADLVTAVAQTLRRFREHPDEVTEAAGVHGVAVEVMEAAVVASVVADWMAGRTAFAASTPGPSLEAEAARASVAAEAGRPVAAAVRLPPLLAIRLVELAAATGETPERAAVAVLAGGVDSALAAVCRRRGRPEPRPWDGGPRRGT